MNVTKAAFLSLAVLALSPVAARAEGEPREAKPAQEKEKQEKKKDRRVFDLTCEGYLALPEASRPVLVGWVAGQGQRKGSFAPWAVDAARQKQLVDDTATECRKTPAASLWVKVQHLVREYK